jgi:hypothetical protein
MNKNFLFLIALLFTSQIVNCQLVDQKIDKKDRFSADSLNGVYIPINLEDCFKQIDSFWPDSTKSKVRTWSEQEFAGRVHMGFGMWMRNNWQLWGGSRLSKYFNDLGVFHPDDMSGIILDSYHRYLTGKEIKLQKQIDSYKAYWTVNKDPEKESYPNGTKKLEFDTKMLYTTYDSMPGCIHIQTNSKTDKTWIYDYYFGWKQLNMNEKIELDSIAPEKREYYLRKIFNK